MGDLWAEDFANDEGILAFGEALAAPDFGPSEEDLLNPRKPIEFITVLNDWKPVRRSVRESQAQRNGKRKLKRLKKLRRGKDETREGWTYPFVKWPLLTLAMGWLLFLTALYLLTRFYIFAYERFVYLAREER